MRPLIFIFLVLGREMGILREAIYKAQLLSDPSLLQAISATHVVSEHQMFSSLCQWSTDSQSLMTMHVLIGLMQGLWRAWW